MKVIAHLKAIGFFLWVMAFAPIGVILPRFRRKVVFGAWLGDQFSDNPKYFLRYLLDNTDFDCYWVGGKHLEDAVKAYGAKFVRKGSIAAFWHVITAKWLVCNIHWDGDIGRIPTYSRSICLNLWHGTALKKIGDAQYNGDGKCAIDDRNVAPPGLLARIKRLRRWLEDWAVPYESYTTCANEKMVDILHRSCPPRFTAGRTIVAGQPRNDFLIANKDNEAVKAVIKQKYGQLFGVPTDKKWYLYMPTWRHDGKDTFSFLRCKRLGELQKILQDKDAIIIEKQHPIVLGMMKIAEAHEGSVHVLSSETRKGIDMQELLLISDLLITDYSSCFFDFETMGRPAIHFAYDYEHYAKQDSGVEYELRDIAAGPIVVNEDELLDALRKDDNVLMALRGKYADEPIAGETGHASERFAKWVGIMQGRG